ncbi:DNA methyltransferase [Alkalibacterium gilvum]|uniref:DNA methyltransferase n=1 Tax=Alkalibacterium gilvum TaxID=1130080 RepID=UPI003F92EEAD
MNQAEQRKAANDFIERWADRGNEKQDSQSFWLDLLHNVYGIDNPTEYITFEDSVSNMMDSTSYIDGYIEKTNVLIEQKGQHRDLNKGLRQSDGTYLTPFQQALRYSATLPYSRRPRWIITSNFKEFYIYDMEKPNSDPSIVKLIDLEKEYYRLEILIDKTNTQIEKETKVSIQAGELIGQIYDELIEQYHNPEDPYSLKSINQLSVRLVFSFYAEDAGLFGKRRMFHDYLIDFDTRNFRSAIIDFFHVLNTKVEDRDPYLDEKLAVFPYVNGGLFEDMDIEIPQFTDHLRELILENASSDFNWSEISPTIFGSVFESTLNPDQRREGGMHYTSIQNIHKVIDPLFLEELKEELNEIKQLKQHAAIKRRALEFQNKLASLTFLDPAAGSGNFLTETYIALRELENEALVLIHGDNVLLDTEADLIKVSLNQFYGIEVNDFAVSVAKTALWIAESQMFEKTKDLVYSESDFLPIKSYPNIVEGNALTMNWIDVVDPRDLDFIIGNPPFIGHSIQNVSQKKEMRTIYSDDQGKEYRLAGKIDYVAGWFFKASQFIKNTSIRVAFVSTNSITQGEQVAGVWQPLYDQFNIQIDYAYKTFKWNNESTDKAQVHVVIIGFSHKNNSFSPKKIYSDTKTFEIVTQINPYLLDAPIALVKSRRQPLSEVSPMFYGSKPTDGGFFFLSPDEKEKLIANEPQAKKYIRKVYGAREFINNQKRYCLWLKNATPQELKNMPRVLERIQNVRDYRLNSKAKSTQRYADYPTLFKQDAHPETNFLLVPSVSSENRRYVPIGFMSHDNIATNAVHIVPNATLYEFGIITSNVHMAWMRTVAGRLEMRYRYSSTLVYNTFPWPKVNKVQKKRIEKAAQSILDARSLYPESSLADLYDELTMPVELRKAHQENDKAVMEAYGMKVGVTTESDSVAQLFKMYEKLISIK